jgi:hypothetical protein
MTTPAKRTKRLKTLRTAYVVEDKATGRIKTIFSSRKAALEYIERQPEKVRFFVSAWAIRRKLSD